MTGQMELRDYWVRPGLKGASESLMEECSESLGVVIWEGGTAWPNRFLACPRTGFRR
jgi:hypothetical protein